MVSKRRLYWHVNYESNTQGDALSSLLFNLTVDGLKINGTHHRPVFFSDEINTLGESVHTMQEKTDAVVVASKEIGLEVRNDKTKHMVKSRDQNAGRSHKIKIDDSSFESANPVKSFGKTQTNRILFRKN